MKPVKYIVILLPFLVFLSLYAKVFGQSYFGNSYYNRYSSTSYYNPYSSTSYSRLPTPFYSGPIYNYQQMRARSYQRLLAKKQRIKAYYSAENLIRNIESPNVLKREEAAELLSRFYYERGVKEALEKAIDDPSPFVRKKAIKSLMGIESTYSLQKTVRSLGEVPFANSQENILILGKVLCSARDPMARKEAAAALGNLENPLALSTLRIAQKRDANLMVQQEIEEAIRKIKNPP